MKTTVMFVADSVPLSDTTVRLGGSESEHERVTDEEGKIELDVELGTHTFAIRVEGEWIERTVHRQGHAPLFVVNVSKDDTQDVTTLNTLQVDLASLVGDRYVFQTVLGRGGMGVVVKAIDRMLNRPVAIKMLSDELRENEEAQQIFLVEARNLATLSHPNLVAIHDILNVGGRVLMVFEYVLGENVEQMIKKRGKIEPKEVLRIAIQLTRCVTYLHEHDLIHRDLKPANIIMQAEGTLKLIDFGLARSLNELYIRGTRVRGTPAYMAPEQIQGIHLTTATDIYQIGISMFEMLTGELPFDSGDLAYAHVHVDPPALQDVAPSVDEELARLVHACLQKRPKDRPASAEILLEQLQQIYARIASRDSQPIGLADDSGPGLITAGRSTYDLAAPVEDPGDVSLVEEVAGGSNRGVIAMLAVGIFALAAAVFLLFTPNDSTRGDAGTTAADETALTGAAPSEPPEAVDPKVGDDAIDAARETAHQIAHEVAHEQVGVGLATAADRSTSIAATAQTVEREKNESEPRTPKKAPSSDAAKGTMGTPEESRRETTRGDVPAESPSAPTQRGGTKSRPEESRPTLQPADEPKSDTGLLSVDEEGSRTLLPVGE